MKNVIIVDDHIMLREGLKAWLKANSDWRVSAEAGTAREFFSVLSDSGETGIDAVIVDVSVGKDNGFDIVCRTRSLYPALNCLIYSMYDSAGYVFNAFKAGAKDTSVKVPVNRNCLRHSMLSLPVRPTCSSHLYPKWQSRPTFFPV